MGEFNRFTGIFIFMYSQAIEKCPWGAWAILEDTPTYKVKKISVNPGHRLSYQKHFKRKEDWFIIEGEALVTLNDQDIVIKAGEFIHIPCDALHRIKNISESTTLIFIEIQRGSYFGEDDIVRISDDYGRV